MYNFCSKVNSPSAFQKTYFTEPNFYFVHKTSSLEPTLNQWKKSTLSGAYLCSSAEETQQNIQHQMSLHWTMTSISYEKSFCSSTQWSPRAKTLITKHRLLQGAGYSRYFLHSRRKRPWQNPQNGRLKRMATDDDGIKTSMNMRDFSLPLQFERALRSSVLLWQTSVRHR
jgi:hypothetical protein